MVGLVATGLLAATVGPVAGSPSLPTLTTPTPSNPLPGATQLPNGWALAPAGTQILTSRAPTGVAVAAGAGADAGAVYAVTSGIFDEAVERVDPRTLIPTKTLVGEAYQGVAADGAGNVWVSGGPANAVFHYKAQGPVLVDESLAGPAPSTPNKGIHVTGYPGTMLLEGGRLIVAGNLSVPSTVAARAAGVGSAGCVGSGICSVVSIVDVSNPQDAAPSVTAVPVGRDAWGLAYRRSTSTLYVSNWADQTNTSPARGSGTGTVSVVNLAAPAPLSEQQVVPVGNGPTGIALSPDGNTLAVANSDSDTVSLLPVRSDGTLDLTAARSVGVGLPGAPLGTTPLAVSYSADGNYLYVALAGLDAIEVLNANGTPLPQPNLTITYRGTAATVTVPATFIPTGWYPDAMTLTASPAGNAARLYVANLRGNGAGPGYYGQIQPVTGTSTEGTLSAIDVPNDAQARAAALGAWTRQVVENDQLGPAYSPTLSAVDPAANPCTGAPAAGDILCPHAASQQVDPHTIHVVQILAENKTFDSYFGDTQALFPGANADPSFTEYPASVTTNQHLLARSFSLSDNFWNEGAESSVLGHSWYTGGYSTVDNEMTWGQTYDQGLRGQRNDGEYAGTVVSSSVDARVGAQESVMLNPRTLLADRVLARGLTERIYSTDLNPGSAPTAYQVPLGYWGEGPTSPVSSDLAFPDVDRANIFLHGTTISHAWDVLEGGAPPPTFGKPMSLSAADKARFTLDAWQSSYAGCISAHNDAYCQQSMPNYLYITLPENHTYDVSNVLNPLDPTPQSMVADNDYAIGKIIEGLSHSPFWKNTIVLLSEDDNQFTGDHVDVHRTFLLAMGGLANTLGASGLVSHQRGSFPSVLKTEELLLGLAPMTLFDHQAAPLHDMVATSVPATNGSGYDAVLPPTPFLSALAPPGTSLP